MDVLNLNFEPYIPDIIEAFIKIYGEEYRKIITERTNNAIVVMYNNPAGIFSYYQFLCECKSIELYLEFFKTIGINIEEYKNMNAVDIYYRHNLSFLSLSRKFIDSMGFNPWALREPKIIKVFNNKDRIQQQIEFLQEMGYKNITSENYNVFMQTEEYKSVMMVLDKGANKCLDLMNEYKIFLDSVSRYKNYTEIEYDNEKKFKSSKKKDLYEKIKHLLSINLLEHLSANYNITEQIQVLLQEPRVSLPLGKLVIESFSRENEERLNDLCFSEHEKCEIRGNRLSFLKAIGIKIDESETGIYANVKGHDNSSLYDRITQNCEIKNLFPSFELVDALKKERVKLLDEAEREIILSREPIKSFIEQHPDIDKGFLYENIKRTSMCLIKKPYKQKNTSFIFYTVRPNDGGTLNFAAVHELIHNVEENNSGSGFDITNEETIDINPYLPFKRKYERINETFADLFALRTLDALYNKCIYIAEPERLSCSNASEKEILMSMILPLYERCAPQIKKARIIGDVSELLDIIGSENFEELNDCVNVVDSLIYHGLEKSIEAGNPNDDNLVQYNAQMQRLNGIYANINDMQEVNKKR